LQLLVRLLRALLEQSHPCAPSPEYRRQGHSRTVRIHEVPQGGGHHAAGPIPRRNGHRSWRTRHNGAVPYPTRTTVSRNYACLSRAVTLLGALAIIAGRGPGGLSIRRLGAALQVQAMAIYRHVPLGKEQLCNASAAYVTSPALTGAA